MSKNRIKHAIIKRDFNQKRYYKPLKYPPIPLSNKDLYIRTSVGDRLDILAHMFYKDIRLWWVIMNANIGIIKRDSYALDSNLEIRIPQNIENIVANFEKINEI